MPQPHKHRTRSSRRAFTLIELLVVVAIVAVLAAILFPVFAEAMEAAKKTDCLGKLRELGTAFALPRIELRPQHAVPRDALG